LFSGLVQAIGTVRSIRRDGVGGRLEIACALPGEPLVAGESVAVDGVCLTVQPTANGFAADVSPETLRSTTLAHHATGRRVNLERSLRLCDRLGGHLVLGHVDAAVAIVAVRPAAAFLTLRMALPAALAPEVAEKGSVALDGVSLTVSSASGGWFEAVLVPATLATTTLGERHRGDLLNLETDVLAKYARRGRGGEGSRLAELLGGGNASD
jgi:riboflavin synthase